MISNVPFASAYSLSVLIYIFGSYMAGTATYGLKPVVLGSLTIPFGTILLKRSLPPTGTRLIKRECSVHICVE